MDVPDDLLDGLDGNARAERAELIEWLLDHEVTVDEIRGSFIPMLLASRRLIGDDGGYVSAREISESTGVDLELLQRIQRAIGLARVDDPDAVVHMRADGIAAAHAQRFLEAGLDPEHLVQVVRVLAEGLSHAAEVMRYTALAAILEPGLTELEIAKRSYELVSRIAPLLGPWIEDMLFMHLRHQMETEAVNASERAAGAPLPGARQVAVAFADLVGFTRLGEVVPPEELVQLAERLANLARDVAVPPVRFVKTIGDAVMFVSPGVVPLLDAVLKLVEIIDTDNEFPRLRAGVAAGPAVSRAGDWFGSPVNVASRVTGVARPGTVLVAESVREAIGADRTDAVGFSWSFAGARRLKGIKGEVKLFRARRGDSREGGSAGHT
ncbi:adenylate/guanylate cyclase domain-containing protein [Mycobacterium heckeshornense]|uniref:pH-sensitive adenylate cyclase n=1 Tax=Mycobacterium heckeshornense TaxID=110505 RepID=A0A2G8B6F2_9MYCO|nr:adenylate/guanylate cyclase domain-containing protein [Mycobacterium heckeshornense]MCV7035013.1 adenylate/guanylate cyclase domain-containing protein [Mycobacterium heckeshornense]PIJ33292.1 adenylate/guanylate cyclase domain-containing protein [Mycobacterium heckeshornense]BCO35046.1 pH-sensitive adenylate cyclase [Mycobacterium heckeshornense]BCQ08214.1 pH-sensitive adenylate cyclase [Mycobacterium heckeshornense]